MAKLVEAWSPYYAASNDPTRLRDMARSLTKGQCGDASLKVQRESEEVAIKATRVPVAGLMRLAGAG